MFNRNLLVGFPKELRELPQWVMWAIEVRDGKKTKVPYQPTGHHASVVDPATWRSFEDCVAAVARFDGVGFVFTDGYMGVDLDHCFEDGGGLLPWAREVLETLPSYTEKSPSGQGLHVIVKTDFAGAGRRTGSIECYFSERFFTVTGEVFEGRKELNDCDVVVWHKETFGEKKEAPVVSSAPPLLPADEKILEVAFNGKNGKRIVALFSGKWQEEGFGSQSEADLSLIADLMFFAGNDPITVDRLFRASKLYRPKWDEQRGDKTYGQKTLDMATQVKTMEWAAPKPVPIEATIDNEYIMTTGKNPVPVLITENIRRVFEKDHSLSSRFRLNDFSHMMEVSHAEEWLNLQENDILDAQLYVSANYPDFVRVSKEMITDVIRIMAYKQRVNPPRDYLRGLVWDMVPRLDAWLHTVYGVPNDELHDVMGSNWLKGLVKRVLEPGYQFDEVLVLEGDQAHRKSASLRILGAPWHVESTLSTEDKDFYMLLARNIIVEFSEGDIVGRTSARKLKAIITKVEDSYRLPYERSMATFKRGCVFAMTTNDNDYQKDETGGRRWLPVVLQKVADTDWLKANRDQLYAEAFHRVMVLKETTHEYPEELKSLQAEKMEYDEISERVMDWYDKLPELVKQDGVLTIDAYNGALNTKKSHHFSDGEDEKDIPKDMRWRIGRVFRTALQLENMTVWRKGRAVKRWVQKRG